MKRLKLTKNAPKDAASERVTEPCHKIQLIQVTPKFEEKKDEMNLFLINFEQKWLMCQNKKDWVAYLLSIVPAEISNMLARETVQKARHYDHIKTFILKRYKLNSEKLKSLFYHHQKTTEKLWKNTKRPHYEYADI